MDKSQQRRFGIATGLIGAALLVFAAFSHEWIVGRNSWFLDMHVDGRVGLRGIEVCDDLDCERRSHAEVAEHIEATKKYVPAEEWERDLLYTGFGKFRALATVSFWLCLVCAGVLLACVALSLRNKPVYWPVQPYSLALLLSILVVFASVLTLALHPFKATGWGTGSSFLVVGAGAVAALFSSLMLGRARPDEPDWLE